MNESITRCDYDQYFKVWQHKKLAGTLGDHRIRYPDHPLINCVLWNPRKQEPVIVEQVWSEWNDFEWHVCLMYHNTNRSSGIPIIGVLHRKREIHNMFPAYIDQFTIGEIASFRSTFSVITKLDRPMDPSELRHFESASDQMTLVSDFY